MTTLVTYQDCVDNNNDAHVAEIVFSCALNNKQKKRISTEGPSISLFHTIFPDLSKKNQAENSPAMVQRDIFKLKRTELLIFVYSTKDVQFIMNDDKFETGLKLIRIDDDIKYPKDTPWIEMLTMPNNCMYEYKMEYKLYMKLNDADSELIRTIWKNLNQHSFPAKILSHQYTQIITTVNVHQSKGEHIAPLERRGNLITLLEFWIRNRNY